MFQVGDKVLFGRNSGEKTLAEVVKVNPKKLQVRILEARGNGRGSAVGAIWVVPFSLCTKVDGNTVAKPTPTPVSAPMNMDAVTFARNAKLLGLPEDCLGKKIKVDRCEVTITGLAMNRSKFPVQIQGNKGGKYVTTVQAVLDGLNALTAPAPTPPQPSPFGYGTDVLVLSWNKKWWGRGVVIANTMLNGRVRVLTNQGTINVKPDEIKICPKRSEKDIMDDIAGCYNSLSPENLTCDGEAPRSQVTRRHGELTRFLKVLFRELGREVSELEACRLETTPCFRS